MVTESVPLTITRLDNNTSVVLSYSQTIDETYKADYATLAVLYTHNPLVKYKYSSEVIELPGVILWDSNKPVTQQLKYLIELTKPIPASVPPDTPVISVSWGEISLPRVRLSQLKVQRRQMPAGILTHAVLDISLVHSPEYPKPKIAPKPSDNVATAGVLKLSQRERDEYAKQVVEVLKKDTKKAAEFSYKPQSVVKVSEAGEVTIDGRKAGKITDFGIKPKPSHPVTDDKAKAPTVPKASESLNVTEAVDRNPTGS